MVFALSFTICMAFVILQNRIQPLYLRSGDQLAVQASHEGEPLRIGGVAVFLAMFAFIGIDSRASTHALGALLMDLSRICAAPSARLGHLAFEGQGAFASQF